MLVRDGGGTVEELGDLAAVHPFIDARGYPYSPCHHGFVCNECAHTHIIVESLQDECLRYK